MAQPIPPAHGQARPHDLAGVGANNKQRPQMVQNQMLQAMYEKHALGVVIHPGMQGHIQKDHAKPEKKLARDSDQAHKTASMKQARDHQKKKQARGPKDPGRKTAKKDNTHEK